MNAKRSRGCAFLLGEVDARRYAYRYGGLLQARTKQWIEEKIVVNHEQRILIGRKVNIGNEVILANRTEYIDIESEIHHFEFGIVSKKQL